MSDTNAITIEPETTLESLLMHFPQLEPITSQLVPTFGRLKPGHLRDTIAKTTTLEQAATSSGLRVPDFVSKLRKAAGLADESGAANLPGMPLWVNEGKIKRTLDARPMLSQGQHPKQLVIDEVGSLQEGEIFVLVTPFVPGPLIELARSMGSQTWTRQGEKGNVETYFSHRQ